MATRLMKKMVTKSTVVSAELFKLLSPILYLSRFYCLCPLEWNKLGTRYVISKSKFFLGYSIVITIFCVSASIWGLMQLYQLDIVYNIRLAKHTERYTTFCDVGLVLISTVAGVVITASKIDTLTDYLSFTNEADSFLQQQPGESFKYSLTAVAITMLSTTGILIFDLILWLNISAKGRNIALLTIYNFPYYFCYYFTVVIELVYWQLVYSIKVRIESMNQSLCQIVKCQNVEKSANKMVIVKNVKNDETLVANRIHDLINAYQNLTGASNAVNNYYGFVILIILLGCFVHLLVTPYILYNIITHTGHFMFVISQMIWMFGHILRTLLILEPCHGCLNQTANTSTLLCKLMSSDLSKETKSLLEIFILYLQQCPIEFSAYGLTKMHRGILTTMTGAVTTYLVILFQFNQD